MPNALVLRGVGVRYGGVVALNDVSLEVTPGSVLGLIGPNGAGKTTLINATTGIATLATGTITLGTHRLDGAPPHRIARAGVARTYQNIRLFGKLSVRTNLAAGAYAQPGTFNDDEAQALLARAGVPHLALGDVASALPYGDQRRLEIARALASHPAIVMLDEPAAGMNPTETAHLVETIGALAQSGIGILLIEHDMTLVRAACHNVVVLNFGEVLARGTPGEVAQDPAVIEAYLGTSAEIA
jgi:branched-chain amino acid transport system permease protein